MFQTRGTGCRRSRRAVGAILTELAKMLAEYWPAILAGVIVAGAVMIGHWVLVVRKRATQESSDPAPVSDNGWEFENPAQKRKSARRVGNPIKIHVALEGHTANATSGYVLDRSMGGLGLSLDDGFEAGTKLVVRPAGVIEMTPWYEVEVVRCQQTGEGWQVSCRFIRTPPYSILLLFG